MNVIIDERAMSDILSHVFRGLRLPCVLSPMGHQEPTPYYLRMPNIDRGFESPGRSPMWVRFPPPPGIESEVNWDRGGTSIYFRDPEGHSVELATPGVWEVY